MSLALLGLGTALPATVIGQAEAAAINVRLCGAAAHRAEWLPSVYAQTGIRTRHTALSDAVLRDFVQRTRITGSPFVPRGDGDPGPTTAERMRHYAELAPPLAARAAAASLAQARKQPSAITHLITVSCTGFVAPGIDVALMESLHLPATVARTHVGFMGCHGAINGLRVAQAFAAAEATASILLCAVELCTLHLHYGDDPQRLVANSLFADGAAAIVGVPSKRAPADAWQVAATGSCLIPGATDAMTWTIGDRGFAMTLSKAVPRLIATQLRPWLVAWLKEQKLCLEDIRSWAVHPGGPRVLTAVEEGLALSAEALAPSRAVFETCGNMSSPTLLFIVDRLRAARATRPCVALGFGPGLIAEAMLLR